MVRRVSCSINVSLLILTFFFVGCLSFLTAEAALKKYQFDVQVKNVSRLCNAKPIVTVNGMFPGPTIYQFRNGWADGPAYITQCPIQTRRNYVYDINIKGQRGTLWWHAHILWLRATVYGAIVIMPKEGTPFPFPQPFQEANLVLDTYALEVMLGKTYLLRIVNAALNDDLFFAIAGHNMTVVEIDAVYTKPFTTQALQIAPGQTTNALVRMDRTPGRYFIAARPFMDAPVPVDNKTATTILQYKGIPDTIIPILPQLPAPNDTSFALNYNQKLRSLNTQQFPANVPTKIDRNLFVTIGLGVNPCPSCQNGTQFTASLNNITFVMPHIGLLQAHYFNTEGVFKTNFPDKPIKAFDYTNAPLTANLGTSLGTRLTPCLFTPDSSNVEIVLQDTNLLTVESHPFHLHGYNFFVVGSGINNFDPLKDPAGYNLVDPPERNTVGVPTGGWTAIRFRDDNP
ncbi:hypothetical protein MKX03_015033, partial [Papaver bracteatum]